MRVDRLTPWDPRLATAIRTHKVDRLAAIACRAEHDETAIRRPAGMLVTPAGGQLHIMEAIRIDRENLDSITSLASIDILHRLHTRRVFRDI